MARGARQLRFRLPQRPGAPRTWLLATGWRRRGLLSLDEVPAARR